MIKTYRGSVRAVVAMLLLVGASIIIEIAAGADYPLIPPGLVLPLAVAGLLLWRQHVALVWAGFAFGAWLAFGAFVAPDMSHHLTSGNALLVSGAVIQILAIAGLVATGGLALFRRRQHGTAG